MQKMLYISSNTVLGTTLLKNYTANDVTFTTPSMDLINAGLYTTSTQINFDLMTTNPTLDLYFSGLGINHYSVYFRVNAWHQCPLTTSFQISIDGGTPKNSNLLPSTRYNIESAITPHTSDALSLRIFFSTTGDCTNEDRHI